MQEYRLFFFKFTSSESLLFIVCADERDGHLALLASVTRSLHTIVRVTAGSNETFIGNRFTPLPESLREVVQTTLDCFFGQFVRCFVLCIQE